MYYAYQSCGLRTKTEIALYNLFSRYGYIFPSIPNSSSIWYFAFMFMLICTLSDIYQCTRASRQTSASAALCACHRRVARAQGKGWKQVVLRSSVGSVLLPFTHLGLDSVFVSKVRSSCALSQWIRIWLKAAVSYLPTNSKPTCPTVYTMP